MFSKFTSLYGNPGFTGKQIYDWKTDGAPAPAPAPSPAPAPAPSYIDNLLGGANAPQLQQYQKNPYLDDMAAGLTDQAVKTWTRNIAPSLRSGAMEAGGFGGSRQGVVEANALNDWSGNLTNSLSQLYGNDYQQSQNRNLQKYGMDQSYNLGLGNLALGNQNSLQNYALGMGNLGLGYLNANNNYDLGLRNNALGYFNGANSYDLGLRSNDLGYANLDAQIAQNNFNNRMTGANFGLSMFDRLLANDQSGGTLAAFLQNVPMQYWQQFMGQANATGGLGGTNTSSGSTPGSPITGAVKGAMTGYDMYQKWLKDQGGGGAGSSGNGYPTDVNGDLIYD